MSEERTLAPFGRRRGRVSGAEALGAYRSLWVDDGGGPPDPKPGQFYMLAAAGGWGGEDGRPYLPRAFSFARLRPRAGGGARLEFLFEDTGPGTERLLGLVEGDEVWLTGPLGVGFPVPSAPPLLVGGGIGVAPLVCLAEALAAGGQGFGVLLGFRDAAHALAARRFGTEPALFTDDGSEGRRGLVTEGLAEVLDAQPSAEVFACGPPPMLESVRRLCAEREVPAQLALESGMACGFGACFGCVVPTRDGYLRLCVDGPVVAAARLTSALAAEVGH